MASAMQTLFWRVLPREVCDPEEEATWSLTSSEIMGGQSSVAQLIKLFASSTTISMTISRPESLVSGAQLVSYSNDELYDLSIDTGRVPCVTMLSCFILFVGVKSTDNSTRFGDSTFYFFSDLMDLA